jgi:hypothetical protein
MKFVSLIASAVALSPLDGLAATFLETFPSPTFGASGSELADRGGWTIDKLGSAGNRLSFMTSMAGSKAGAIGGYYDIPVGSEGSSPVTAYLSHSVAIPLNNSSFSTQFAITQSSEDWPGRDGFGFSFRDASNVNLFRLSFVPTTVFVPLSATFEQLYQVSYQFGTGPVQTAKTSGNGNVYFYPDSMYSFSFLFAHSGLNPGFTARVTGTNTLSFSGVATGLGGSTISSLGAEYNTIPGNLGDNFMSFDNISLIPEPSSSLLAAAGIAGLILVRRRK